MKQATEPKELSLLWFRVGPMDFGVEAGQVEGILPFRRALGEGFQVIDLARHLGLEGAAEEKRLLLLKGAEVGVIVNDVLDVISLPSSQLRPLPSLIKEVTPYREIWGIGLFGDRLLLLLDLNLMRGFNVKRLNVER